MSAPHRTLNFGGDRLALTTDQRTKGVHLATIRAVL